MEFQYFNNTPSTIINLCQAITFRNIIYSVNDLEEFIDFVKSDSKPENITINKLRAFKKKSPEFKKIKLNQISCAIIHFNYANNKMISENTKNPTGYLFFDIDNNISEILKQQLDKNQYIAAYWKSVSNTGFGLAVRVSGITPSNYLDACKYIRRILKLPIDKKAHSIDRLTVLSYDPDAVYKPTSTIIDIDSLNLKNVIPNESSKNKEKYKQPLFRNTINKDKSLLGIHCDGKITIRYDNLNEVTENMKFHYNNDGIHDCGKNKVEYTNTYMPKNVKTGNRERTLGLYAKNLLFLNPDLTKELLYKIISNANMRNLLNPLDYKEVQSIVAKAYDNQSGFKSYSNKDKRFFFKDVTLTPVEKSIKCLEVLNEEKRQKTQEKKNMISEILCNWNCHKDGKITPKKVIELGDGILKKTLVYDYFRDNKEDIPICE
ncbi:BT4734/BF3469 family protein [Chryseobacterium polytrichastri]|uniref:VirE N-terminal domain-containing protein n=1 Tax=Chryseobacterium polytrichastri TaxID=1302687 RepID=A0A1M6TBD4_9FLAO|nr:BT4734/BF3469 family protein [Chryseobacterium polytrichastri]SHK54303.1 VirE N-terminal domain-containing protein [Chryseobacterium polytrichastri]